MNYDLLFVKAKKANITEIEIYEEESNGISLEVFNGEVEKNMISNSKVVSIRGAYNGKLACVYVENMNDEKIDYIISTLINNALATSIDEPYIIYPGDKEYPTIEQIKPDFEEFTLKQKIDMCLDLEKRCLELDKRVEVEGISYEEENSYVTIQNSVGLNIKKNVSNAVIVASIAAKEGDQVKSGFEYKFVKKIKDFDLEELSKKVVSDTIGQLNPVKIESKKYTTVLDNSVVRSIMAGFIDLFSGQSAIKKTTPLLEKVGTQIFGENITIIDDGMTSYALNKRAFDDEGVASTKTEIVLNGRLETLLHNLKTAQMLNTKSTSNGYKQSIQSNVDVTPSNLYMVPGTSTLEELFAKAKDGIYITNVMGVHAGINAIAGTFSLQASGYVIKDGKKEDAVTLIILSGNIYDMLKDVSDIGNEIDFGFGRIGMPALLIRNLSISQ